MYVALSIVPDKYISIYTDPVEFITRVKNWFDIRASITIMCYIDNIKEIK
jgi:hypothetical protein